MVVKISFLYLNMRNVNKCPWGTLLRSLKKKFCLGNDVFNTLKV